MDYKPLINVTDLGKKKQRAKRIDRIAWVVLAIINAALAVGLYNGMVMRGLL